MYSRNPIVLTALAVLTLLPGGCSRSRIRLPVQEIDRPISLPHNSSQIGLEWWALINTEDFSLRERHITPVILYPYFWLGEKWEFYIPGVIRYYLAKNTEIQNNTIRITGANAAVHGGWTGVSYYGPVGFIFHFEAGFNYKRSLNERLWFASDAGLIYQTNTNIYGGWAQAGFGCQISRHLYATLKPSYSIYNPYVNDGYLISFPEIARYFTLPLLVGVNVNRTVSLFWQSSVIYYRNYNVRYGQNLGFRLTW